MTTARITIAGLPPRSEIGMVVVVRCPGTHETDRIGLVHDTLRTRVELLVERWDVRCEAAGAPADLADRYRKSPLRALERQALAGGARLAKRHHDVRPLNNELHREWQRGLVEGELEQDQPVLPSGQNRRARERVVDEPTLAAMIAALPKNTPTRISAARDFGTEEEIEAVPVRRIVELGGFVVHGPFEIDNW